MLYPKEISFVPFGSGLLHASSCQDKQKTKAIGRRIILAREMLLMLST